MGQALELDGESFKAEGREKLIKEEYQIKLTSVRIPQSPSYAHILLDLRWPRWRLNSRYLGSPVPNTRGGWKVYAVWFGGLHKMNGNVNHVSPLRTLLSRPDQPKDKMKKNKNKTVIPSCNRKSQTTKNNNTSGWFSRSTDHLFQFQWTNYNNFWIAPKIKNVDINRTKISGWPITLFLFKLYWYWWRHFNLS